MREYDGHKLLAKMGSLSLKHNQGSTDKGKMETSTGKETSSTCHNHLLNTYFLLHHVDLFLNMFYIHQQNIRVLKAKTISLQNVLNSG